MHGSIDRLLSRPSIAGWELRAGIESFAHHCANALGLSGIKVQWSKGTRTAAISRGGDLYLSNVKDSARINRALFTRYVGFVVHELLHRKYTDFLIGAGVGPFLAMMHNAVEDVYIERRGIREGLLGNIEGLLTDLIGGMVAEALAEVTDWADPNQYPFAMAVTGRRYAPRVPLAGGLAAIFDEASLRIDSCRSSTDTLAVAQWIIDQLALPPEPAQPDAPTTGNPDPDAGEQGKPQAGTAGKPQAGKDEAGKDEAGKDGKPDGKDAAKGKDGQAGGTGKDGQASKVGEPGGTVGNRRSTGGYGRKPREVEPTLDPGDAQDKASFNESEILKDEGVFSGGGMKYPVAVQIPARLRSEVRRLFENSGRTDHQRGKPAGSIDTGALASTAVGNNRVFKRRLDVEGIDSAVVIMLDLSSSMYGDRITAAIPACAALMETLVSAGVDVCITAFSNRSAVIKPWSMPARRALALLPDLAIGGGTKDYAALRHAHGLLLRHPARRRVCFSLTDGDGQVDEAYGQVLAGEALGITTIGVGIHHRVHAVYPQNVTVWDLNDLGSVMLRHIKLAA
jgi:hypothetical protein